MSVDVAVVGAGISGLAAAYELQRRGVRVRVLEASDRLGGVIRSDRFDGWVIDAGPDSLLVQKPAAVALCRELGLGDRLISTLTPRTAYILRNDRLHALPEGSFLGFPLRLGALANSSLFSLGGKLRMACEVLIPRTEDDEDESIASFVRRRFGQEAVDYLAEPLLAGIHAGDVDRLSVRALFPRLVDAERQSGSIIRAFRALRMKPAPQGAFVSLPGGVAELADALIATFKPGTLVTGTRVTDLRRAAAFLIETTAGTVEARAVILAVPAYAAGGMLRGIHTGLAALCEDVPYASTATVAFGYRSDQIDHPMRGSGFVVPRVERSPLLAATWVTSKWPHRAPEGHVLLRAFLGGGRDARRLDQTDAELIDLAREALAEVMPITGDPMFTRLYRWTRQSPQYEVGHLERMAAIELHLARVPGLFVTGSGFRSIGIPDCIADGRDTAARAAAFVA
ncbi:MAG TPA: protoporphyrinogen oxidase [Vicinamibacterales bacterium]|nr:protoporphyrinogen oxidase [Vicinamibacterales bacterium]